MVACNPRDREAAHRAEVEGIATADPNAVTCKLGCYREHWGVEAIETAELSVTTFCSFLRELSTAWPANSAADLLTDS